MKKNFTVNIGGRIFNIDDDAYERLNQYLAGLKSYFAADEGRDEIISDIESRIAELLEQKKSSGSVIITLSHINEVIAGMGEPDQLSGEEPGEKTHQPGKSSGKLFRNPDHRLIGGVASGIAAYFNVDPTWVRLFFVAITFTYGIGLILYPVLWLILPVARTTSEKLEMQRRFINIDTLRQEVISTGSGLKKTGNSLLGSLGRILRFFTELLTYVFRLFLKVLKMAAGVFMLGLVLLVFIGLGLSYIIREPMNMGIYFLDTTTLAGTFDWLVPGPSVRWLSYLAITLLLTGLAGMLIYLGLRLLLKWPPVRWQVLGLFGLLIAGGLVTGGLSIYQYSRSTEEMANASKVEVMPYKHKMIRLSMSSDDPDRYWKPLDAGELVKNRQLVLGEAEFSVRPTEDSLFFTGIREATAYREDLAAEFLGKIEYQYILNDTLLSLNPFFTFPKSDGMRHQKFELVMGIPLNTLVKMDETTRWKINYRDFTEHDMDAGEFIMTRSGLQPVPVVMDTVIVR